jgi:hypothetical protein
VLLQGFQKVQKALSPSSHHHAGGGSSDSSSLVPSVQQFCPISRDPEAELRSHPSDPEADEAVLRTIDLQFFTSDSFDPSLYELEVSCLVYY